MAYETQSLVSQSGSERAWYLSRLKFELDRENNYNTAIDEGETRKAIAIARNLFRKGLPVDLISETTGLTEEELNNIILSI
ncbi:MAG: hypothetical protein LBM87_07585 [Ruminococcus sp.]|nr:hypothetical protein [Ruminococcus sp.]